MAGEVQRHRPHRLARAALREGSCRCIGWLQSRIYHGVWATAAFQPLCPRNSMSAALPLMPEWYLVIAALVAFSALGLLWAPLLVGLPLAGMAALAALVQAARSASAASYPHAARSGERLKMYATTVVLHLVHPLGRLWGRLGYGLTPWRRRMERAVAWPRARAVRIWSEQWQPAEERLKSIEAMLKSKGVAVRRGGAFDNWDLGSPRRDLRVYSHSSGSGRISRRATVPPFPGLADILQAGHGCRGAARGTSRRCRPATRLVGSERAGASRDSVCLPGAWRLCRCHDVPALGAQSIWRTRPADPGNRPSAGPFSPAGRNSRPHSRCSMRSGLPHLSHRMSTG